MAALRCKVFVVCALLVLGNVFANENGDEDEATVETVEESIEEVYQSPQIDSDRVHFAEHFDDKAAFKKRWVQSEAKKQGVDENIAKYDGKWEIQSPSRQLLRDDLGLVLTSEAKHAAIAALLDKPFVFKDKPLVVQYEVTMQEGQTCGGAYLKLLSKGTDTKADLRKFHDQTAYTIMFGPDKCGNDNKLHFIFRHKNPKNGSIEEKHSKKPSQRLEDIYKDKEPHLYTLIVRPDNTFSVLVDNKEVNAGSLLEDFTPPVNPPEEIPDPDDSKPADWDDREKIVDPTASKPADWDEEAPREIVDPNAVKPDGWLDDVPELIPDPEAVKPSDWDSDMDGSWEAPLVDNPACAAPGCGPWRAPVVPNPDYKGKWHAPLITNPNYKGKWTPRMIPNPHYFKDDHPYKMTPIHAVGFELWSMSGALLFDNLIVAADEAAARAWADQGYARKRDKLNKESESVWDRALRWAGANPWVYAVLLLGAVVVVGLLAYCCCGTRTQEDDLSELKKTDAVLEDDPHESEDESPAPRGKASLEDAEEEEEEEAEEETPLVDTEAAGDAQRKRKPRRE